MLSAAEQFLKIELMKNFRVSRSVDEISAWKLMYSRSRQVIRDLELLPEFGGQNWSAVFLQKFEGTVTIWPKSRSTCDPAHLRERLADGLVYGAVWDWFRILTDPDPTELARMIRVGQNVTWPKVG